MLGEGKLVCQKALSQLQVEARPLHLQQMGGKGEQSDYKGENDWEKRDNYVGVCKKKKNWAEKCWRLWWTNDLQDSRSLSDLQICDGEREQRGQREVEPNDDEIEEKRSEQGAT